MFIKKIILLLFIFTLYQTQLYSKSNSFLELDAENLSNYFSGIVAFENKNNSDALDFFDSSKDLINKHDTFLKRYIFSLVMENKVSSAINVIKKHKNKDNKNFLEFYLLLIADEIRNNDFNKAESHLLSAFNLADNDRLNLAILETTKEFIHVFQKKKILENKKNFGNLSLIAETFQRCYLRDVKTEILFSNLVNNYNQIDYTRYLYFFLSYLIENERFNDADEAVRNIEYINSTLLLSQGKNWIENKNYKKFEKIFTCQNHNDVFSEFLFLISNLYSSQNSFEKSNFYLNLSNFLNPKFVFNLSLEVENYYLNKDYDKAKKILRKFKKEDIFYHWYRVKKEAQIIAKIKNNDESLNFIIKEFNKIEKPNKKILFDLANFYKNSKKYDEAIRYYTKIIDTLEKDEKIKSDLLYRRGGSYERAGKYEMADKDLLHSLKINPDDAYVLNYLAYSWLERNYQIDKAIEMLEIAYEARSDDPYIIDSIGWAYFLIDEYTKAEKFLRRAVELMPDDPIVNDHYGDILWKLNRKVQARYFWKNVIQMDDAEKKIIDKINIKLVEGL